ncbi:MAG: hypothetical protein E7675_05355 [Ruminococcaceae bacterium]|nr:hypothetical protein [Oscillospiraceae bacterium]
MKRITKIVAIALVALMLVPQMASCSNSSKRSIYSVGDVSITDDLYRYWLSYYKSYYAKYFSDIEDTEEGWQKEVTEGITAEKYVMDVVDKRMKMYAAALNLYEEYGLELSDSAKAEIASAIEGQIEYYGGRSALGNALRNSCNITIDTLEDVYEVEKKVQQLSDFLYGEYGISKINDQQLDQYYKDNFSRIKYLYFDKVNKYIYNDDGSIKVNSAGKYQTQALTEEEKKEVEKKAKEALENALSGKDFNDLIKIYNTPDMDYSSTLPDGYYVSAESYTSSYVYTLVSKSMKMKVGDIELAEDDYAYYVIAKYELVDKAYKTDKTGQLEHIEKYAIESYYNKLLEEKAKEVTVDTDYLSKIKLVNIGGSVNI